MAASPRAQAFEDGLGQSAFYGWQKLDKLKRSIRKAEAGTLHLCFPWHPTGQISNPLAENQIDECVVDAIAVADSAVNVAFPDGC
jgi:hypothetical protein